MENTDELVLTTDEIEQRVSRIAEVLIEQYNNERSKKVLLFMFHAFRDVQRDRQHYLNQDPQLRDSRNAAWAQGYLTCAAQLISHYLERRFKIVGCTLPECQRVVELDRLVKVFQDSPQP
jgi:hypothetical protein